MAQQSVAMPQLMPPQLMPPQPAPTPPMPKSRAWTSLEQWKAFVQAVRKVGTHGSLKPIQEEMGSFGISEATYKRYKERACK